MAYCQKEFKKKVLEIEEIHALLFYLLPKLISLLWSTTLNFD